MRYGTQGVDLGQRFHQVAVVDGEDRSVVRPFRIGRGRRGVERLIEGCVILWPPMRIILPGPPPTSPVSGTPSAAPPGELPSPAVPVTETVVPDTVRVDSVAVVPAFRDTTAAPPVGGVRPFTIESTTTVVEVERAILDNDLLRTTSVLFEFNSAAILPASVSVLNTLGIVLQRHPEIRLEIGGHSDGRGPDEYNMQLSLRRATAVRDYLLGNYAIDTARLTAQGFGESRPIADDATATGRAINRRVEFTLIR